MMLNINKQLTVGIPISVMMESTAEAKKRRKILPDQA